LSSLLKIACGDQKAIFPDRRAVNLLFIKQGDARRRDESRHSCAAGASRYLLTIEPRAVPYCESLMDRYKGAGTVKVVQTQAPQKVPEFEMSKLLIYIGEGQCFDLSRTAAAIAAIHGISSARQGNFIGAVFECDYSCAGRTTVVRLSKDLETVTVEGLGDEAMDFAIKLQQSLPELPLYLIDMDYSFNLELSRFWSGDELRAATEQA